MKELKIVQSPSSLENSFKLHFKMFNIEYTISVHTENRSL